MSLANDVYSALKSEYDSGLTQVEIAARHHVRHGQIQPILSGKRSTAGHGRQNVPQCHREPLWGRRLEPRRSQQSADRRRKSWDDLVESGQNLRCHRNNHGLG